MCADASFLASDLLRERILISCLGSNLVELGLTSYNAAPPEKALQMDCLSSLGSLRHLHIDSSAYCVWETSGLLSTLTNLESFTYEGYSKLTGPHIPALGVLPALTKLQSSRIPGDGLGPCDKQFTALEVFVKDKLCSDGEEHFSFALHLLPKMCNMPLSTGQPFAVLSKLALTDCSITSAAVSLGLLPQLTTVEFKHCLFQISNWLAQSLAGAMQLVQLCVEDCALVDIPPVMCQLTILSTCA